MMNQRVIEVVYGEDEPCWFSWESTLSEMAESLSAGDLQEKRRIRFFTFVNGQMIAIGDDRLLKTFRDQAQGSLRLMAKQRSSGSSAPHSQAQSDTYSVIPDSASAVNAMQSFCSTAATARTELKFRVVNDRVLSDVYTLQLESLESISLYRVSVLIMEYCGFTPSNTVCYLYSSCGWPLGANIRQLQLIAASKYLQNGDLVFALPWVDSPPKEPLYINPEHGSSSYCFDYEGNTYAVLLDPGCSISDFRAKIMWKISVPLENISVKDSIFYMPVNDDYVIKVSDIVYKTLNVSFTSLISSFAKVDEIFSVFDQKEMRKRYGYLYLLSKHASDEEIKALEFIAHVLTYQLEPAIFALHLTLKGCSLSKSEKIALFYGIEMMVKEYQQFVAADIKEEYSFFIGLYYHLAATLSANLATKVVYTENAGVPTMETIARSLANIPPERSALDVNLTNSLKYHITFQRISINSTGYSCFILLTSAALNPPLIEHSQSLSQRVNFPRDFEPSRHLQQHNKATYIPSEPRIVGLSRDAKRLWTDWTRPKRDLI